jgi:hypothetical protein
MAIIIVMLAVGVGLLIGSLVTTAHDAHERFTRYRTATNSSLSAWFKSIVTATITIVVIVLLIYALAAR